MGDVIMRKRWYGPSSYSRVSGQSRGSNPLPCVPKSRVQGIADLRILGGKRPRESGMDIPICESQISNLCTMVLSPTVINNQLPTPVTLHNVFSTYAQAAAQNTQ